MENPRRENTGPDREKNTENQEEGKIKERGPISDPMEGEKEKTKTWRHSWRPYWTLTQRLTIFSRRM